MRMTGQLKPMLAQGTVYRSRQKSPPRSEQVSIQSVRVFHVAFQIILSAEIHFQSRVTR
jgi:hypothetical protein